MSQPMMAELGSPVKWAGGKAKVTDDLLSYVLLSGCTRYVEPFLGGGALMWEILKRFPEMSCYGADRNAQLINVYRQIRCALPALLKKLNAIQEAHISAHNSGCGEAHYKNVRQQYNDAITVPSPEQAARFLALNKLGWRGLYRVSYSTGFNVPYTHPKHPIRIFSGERLGCLSLALANVQLESEGYKSSLEYAKPGTLFFLDAPYRPRPGSSGFTEYTRRPFRDHQQEELLNFLLQLEERGAHYIYTNSPWVMQLNPGLFKERGVRYLDVSRGITANKDRKVKVRELLLTNIA